MVVLGGGAVSHERGTPVVLTLHCFRLTLYCQQFSVFCLLLTASCSLSGEDSEGCASYRNAVRIGLALLLPPHVLLELATPALVLTLYRSSVDYLLSAGFYFLFAVNCFLFLFC